MELLLETAGESHGPGLIAILAGIPAGSSIDADVVNACLAARQHGHGSSSRQKTEQDRVEFLAGVRDGQATGNPIALRVGNKDQTYKDLPPVHTPRPGHADLPGALNRGLTDARNIVERSSARETAVRVAAGSIAAQMLASLGVRVLGHTVAIGGIDIGAPTGDDLEAARVLRNASSHHALGAAAAQDAVTQRIDQAKKAGDTLGGIIEVVATGVPVGLGGHERPESKLSAGLAAAVMGIQAVRGVEFGLGFESAALPGSEVHDSIVPGDAHLPARPSNRVGGIEGGMSTGQAIIVRAAMKPLATLRSALPSVDLRTGEAAPARIERSDTCAVSRLAIVAEAVVALELARHVRRRFGGAHIDEVREAIERHQARLQRILGAE